MIPLMLQVLAIFFMLMTSGSALALDLRGFEFTDSFRYSSLEDGLSERFSGRHLVTTSFSFVESPLYLTDEDSTNFKKDIIDHNKVLSFGYLYYFTDKFAVGADIAAVKNEILGESFSTITDSRFRFKHLLLEKMNIWHLSINSAVTIPTGEEENFTSSRKIGGNGQLVFEAHKDRNHLLLSVGYGHSAGAVYQIIDQRNLALFQLGLSRDILDTWNVNLEMYRNLTLKADKRQDEGDYLLTLKHRSTGFFSTYAGVGVAGPDELERRNLTVFLGAKFHGSDESEERAPSLNTPPDSSPVDRRSEEDHFGVLLEIQDIYFENNRYDLSGPEREKLELVNRQIQALGNRFSHIVIEGLASSRGDPLANLRLSQRRSSIVRDVLIVLGVHPAKISILGYGDQMEQHPKEWKNRRVQFRLYRKVNN